jgi:hypothetical protein
MSKLCPKEREREKREGVYFIFYQGLVLLNRRGRAVWHLFCSESTELVMVYMAVYSGYMLSTLLL